MSLDTRTLAALKVEAARCGRTMGELLDQIVQRYFVGGDCIICGTPARGRYCGSCQAMLHAADVEWSR